MTAQPATDDRQRPDPGAVMPSPEPIMRVATGFMAAKHLFAANELGLFESLAESPATLDALAARTGLTRRAARISADAMVALGLLEREDDLYRNSETTATFLAGRPGPDLRPFLRFWDRLSYPTWQTFAQALASGPTEEIITLEDELQQVAAAGIEAILAGPANALGRVVDLATCDRLLDVGGGTGSWSIALAAQYPQLRATVLELPAVAQVAGERIASAGLERRIDVVTGDALHDELPTGYDTFLVANVVHYWSPETNRALLRRVRSAAAPGARLLLADFWTDPTHTEPVVAALMAGEFAVHLREGDVYSVDEVRAWLADTGWRFLSHETLAGPVSLVAAQAD